MCQWWGLAKVINPGGDLGNEAYGFVNADTVESLYPVSYVDGVNHRDVWYAGVTAPGVPDDLDLVIGFISQTLDFGSCYTAIKNLVGGRD